MSQESDKRPADTEVGNADYAAPEIESIITPADLEREVHYAGATDAASLGQP